MSTRHALSRRTFLRGTVAGTAVALALPPLEAMFGGRGAYADGSAPPPIFGTFFWANGLPWHGAHTSSAVPDGAFDAERHVDLWTPSTVGAGYAATPLLEPIAHHAPSVISGLQPHTNWVTGGETDGHMRGFMVALTSDRVNPEGFHHNSHTLTASRESLDQFVARHPDYYGGAVPRLRSMHLSVSESRFHDYGHWNAISYNGPNSLNPPITNAGQLYDLLFGVPDDAVVVGRRVALLDAVMEEYHGLRGRLGAADKVRIDAHVEHLFEVQRSLELSLGTCEGAGERPRDLVSLHLKTQVMAELLALGLSCGVTRVFTFMLTSPATTHVFGNLPGVINGMHTVCHAGEWENVRKITLHQMQAFGIFLDALAAAPMTLDQSVLDASLIYGTSEYGEGWKHGVQEMPVVLAGGAGGALVRGVHTREAGGNMAKAHTTLLRSLGLPVDSYGFHGAETSDEFSELRV